MPLTNVRAGCQDVRVDIDDRLERLTARHEALTESVEMLKASMEQAHQQFQEENRQRDKLMGEIMEGIARLLHVAQIHEQRIERLEGQR